MGARELVDASQEWEWEAAIFICTIIIWKDGDNFYVLRHPHRKFDLDALPAPEPVPKQDIWGRWHSGLTEAPALIDSQSYYLKSPSLVWYKPGMNLGDDLMREAEIFEILRTSPHPNVCTYYGCLRKDDYATHLCLKKYRCTLREAVAAEEAFDRSKVVEDIRRGVGHIHSLGLVHNDVTPHNVMFDEDGTAVIVDFDSCVKEGLELVKGLTPDWGREGDKVSLKENDFYGLGLIAKWLGCPDPTVDSEGVEAAVAQCDVASTTSHHPMV